METQNLPEHLTEESFVNKALTFALNQNPALSNIDNERVIGLVRKAALEMAAFEKLARTNPLRIPETSEEAKRIKAIWDLSGVGTYLKQFHDYKWVGTAWARWTDRRRLNYSGALMRRLTEKVTGKSYKTPLGEKLTPQQAEELSRDIEASGPYLIYGATAKQNEDLETTLSEQGIVIPKNKVHIINFLSKPVGVNTLDQIKTFSLPPNLQIQEGNILVLVAHAPHMVRALHMTNKFKPFPEGLIILPHPLPSPISAGTDYAIQEISGLLYYTFITRDSSEESYPYKV